MNDLRYYIHCFENLRRDKKKGGAPHKPVLLLSVIELYEKDLIYENRIYISPELVGSFKSHWAELVLTDHQMIFALPFYHMRSEPFWKLVANPGCERWIEAKSSMRSFSNLRTAVSYAEIDNDLYSLMLSHENREILKLTLLEKYFHQTKNNNENGEENLFANYSKQIFQDDPEEYKRRILRLKDELGENAYEEEIFVRGGVFKREVPKIYNNTCAISKLRIDATISVSMIDACHIVPFSESYNDTITNGLALCPNLHRAFDRGLISIGDNYQVMISPKFNEAGISKYSINQFEGKKILLPDNKSYYPSQDNLFIHRKKFGF